MSQVPAGAGIRWAGASEEVASLRLLHAVLKIRTTQTSFSWAPEGLGSEFLLASQEL